MNLTRIFTVVGLVLVLMAVLAAGLKQLVMAIALLGFVVLAGIGLAVWNGTR